MKEAIRTREQSEAYYKKMWVGRLVDHQRPEEEEDEGKYMVEKLLGEGAFGIAILARTPDGKKVAQA